jgi:hypothetical protein
VVSRLRKAFSGMLYPDSLKSRKRFLAFSGWVDSAARMSHSGFPDARKWRRLIAAPFAVRHCGLDPDRAREGQLHGAA